MLRSDGWNLLRFLCSNTSGISMFALGPNTSKTWQHELINDKLNCAQWTLNRDNLNCYFHLYSGQARVKLQWPTTWSYENTRMLAFSQSPSSIYFIVLDCSHFIIFFLILKETKPPVPGPLCSRPILHLTLQPWVLVNPGDDRVGIKLSVYSILVLKECFFCWIIFFGIMPLLTPPTLWDGVFLPRHLL